MKLSRIAQLGTVAAVASLTLAGCAGPSSSGGAAGSSESPSSSDVAFTIDSSLSGTITAGGSSAQSNAQAAWTSAYNAQAKGVTINYDKSQGSGGGVTNFLSGAYDFAGSDSPLNADQTSQSVALCTEGGVNIPVYLDGVAMIFNIPGVTELKLSGETIAKIFALQITDWSDPAITADNGTELPAGAITTVARSDGSGTTQNFTNYLAATQSSVWTYPAGKDWPVEGNVSKQKGGSGVVEAVKAGSGTIGYADHSAVGDLNSAAVIQDGTAVAYSPEAVTATFEAAAVDASNGIAGDLSKKFDYSKLTAETYPIPLVSYAITCSTFKDAKQSELVKSYLGFVTSSLGQQVAAKNAGSAPLPDSVLEAAAETLSAIK
ncbi:MULTISPECIES: phosphate ABC transporter substrate-binding protein PstS [unclassified Microbacterium]|uniref:phosphate ABC transporter substrate-binding protein PstS n=1 Tax=unclassified Microbacterium TaxID=2609290 RepID=UPI0006F9ABFC|nr:MULTISPECIES: phosphate ABC transporter substrate-binding protein PstS [unclassified Microbacterium]MBD8206043.1 phosphate ABC transporter substrate-binding protein PstS [Microbacterium sp. CFBP 8801]MBD8219636.1 phosphate ABC transporter substrate-binding protein PstS [Microbacterium sp. CFBP 13617]MBD8478919.1 phosphate ABC transporter substrate-binding protein PstS [Microbacterium sp. CFBP 8794]MBD8510410.1 phosphate ABC transporter substrate-binding protein PstS [Microbacterium sp. CFBP 